MAPRSPIIGGNWKMNLRHDSALALAEAVAEGVGDRSVPEVFLAPPFPYLPVVRQAMERRDSPVRVGAQDCSADPDGARTGEVSVGMVQDMGCAAVIVGHSERRHVMGERDALINRKLRAVLDAGLEGVLCVGETLDQREAGQTDFVNAGQLALGLAGVPAEQMGRVVIAYEPVWAIGTGRTATPEDAQAAHEGIRRVLARMLYDERIARQTRIQYGGSVKPDNATDLFHQPDIDGGLIGGASLKADDFMAIVEASPQRE